MLALLSSEVFIGKRATIMTTFTTLAHSLTITVHKHMLQCSAVLRYLL
jgi:hypothetical protein